MSTTAMSEARLDLECSEAQPLLPLVADGAMTAADDPALFTHLSRCTDCQQQLAQHDLIGLAVARLPPLSLAQQRRRRITAVLRIALPLAAAASLAIAAVGVWQVHARPSTIATAQSTKQPQSTTAMHHAPAAATAEAPASALVGDVSRVVLPGGTVVYAITRGGDTAIVDINALDGATASPTHQQSTPVGLW